MAHDLERRPDMRRGALAVLGLLALTISGAAELPACGDKFLVGVRGGPQLRFAGAVHPTRILVYWNTDLNDDSGNTDESTLEASLEEAGHSVAIVNDTEALYHAAVTGGFEVILMDVGDAREEQRRLAGVTPQSTILPVLHFPTRPEYSAAKKEFGHAVKTPTTLDKLLSQIEKVRPQGH
jgi:hypothetical protein